VEVHAETKVIDGDDCSFRVFKNIKTGELITRAGPVHAPTDHWIIIGNAGNILPEIPNDTIDLSIFSPPYYNNSKYFPNLFPNLASWENLMETVARESFRILQEGRIAAIIIGDVLIKSVKYPLTALITSIFIKAGFKYRDHIVWRKPNSIVRSSLRNYGWQANPYPYRLFMNSVHESILIFQRGEIVDMAKVDSKTLKKSHLDPWEVRGNHWHLDHWEIDNGFRKPDNERKIASFPEEIAYRLIKLFSFEGGTILDPFAGSGTTMKVARKLYRHSIGIEMRRDFASVIKEKTGFNNGNCTFGTPEDTFNVVYRGQRKRPKR
jgi:site-specific DNA-methyltransferase (adenine-specific)